MAKSRDAFRTISEVADWLDIQTHVLRFWESKFAQVKPVKRAGGRRYYRRQDMLLLGGIKKLLHDDGLTIKGAQKILREEGVKYVSSLSRPVDAEDAVTATAEPVPAEAPAVETPAVEPQTAENPPVDTPAPVTASLFDAAETAEVAPAAEETVETAEAAVETAAALEADTAQEDSPAAEDEAPAPQINDEVMEDFVLNLRHVSHIPADKADQAAALAARFAAIHGQGQETAQA